MSQTNNKSLIAKIAPIAAKISMGGLIISVVGLLISTVLKRTLTEPWPIYYASLAEQIFIWVAVVTAILCVVCDFRRFWAWLKERLRKMMVYLKRNPSIIPMLTLVVAFLVYSLNLTDLSDSTARIQGKGMGLSQFCMMLFTLLSMVCMLNAFPRRKKPNYLMIAVMFVMFAIVIYSDIHYSNAIMNALNRSESPIELTEYIAGAYNMLRTYMVLIIVTAALVVLMPVYSKLLRKVKTSVAVEGNGEMEQIEISE